MVVNIPKTIVPCACNKMILLLNNLTDYQNRGGNNSTIKYGLRYYWLISWFISLDDKDRKIQIINLNRISEPDQK